MRYRDNAGRTYITGQRLITVPKELPYCFGVVIFFFPAITDFACLTAIIATISL
jgi:hypothetical protein